MPSTDSKASYGFQKFVVLATSSSIQASFVIIQIYNLDELKMELKFLIKYVMYIFRTLWKSLNIKKKT